MTFKLKVRDVCVAKVKGEMPTESGATERFDFTLTCNRVTGSQLVEETRDVTVTDFMRKKVTGWDGVLDESGNPVPFSKAGLDDLLDVPGMPVLAYQAYLASIGAKEKN